MAPRRLVVSLALVAFATSLSRIASADDCPAGSRMKTEEGFSWCEPSVCQNDGNCSPSEVCRPVPLCVQVGKLDEKAGAKDAAQRLVATQRCAPDKTCPDTTACSDMSRCVSKAVAEKMGLLSAPSASSSAAPAAGDAKKSSCGCTVAGDPQGAGLGLSVLAAMGLAIGSRRIHRRTRRAPDGRH